MADANDRLPTLPTPAVQALSADGLPSCTIALLADGTWHVTAHLSADAQAALAAAALSPASLCQHAQHALGLAGIGSIIDPAHTAVGIATDRNGSGLGAPTLILDGAAILWWVAHAPADALQVLADAAIQAMRAADR